MPVSNILDVAPAPHEAWRPGLRNQSQDAGILVDVAEGFGGVEYQPFTRGVDNVLTFDPCAAVEYPFAAREGNVMFLPWAIATWDDCPVQGAYTGGAMDLVSRVTDKLTRQTSHLTEKVLWTGAIPEAPAATDTLEELAASVTPDANNRRLASNAATLIDGGAAHDITVAFGLINEWLAGQIGGERGWIHLEARVVAFLAFYGQGIRNGRIIDTNLADHRIVAGTGYDGSGPPNQSTGADESWIYVTTPVRFFQGPILAPNDPGQLQDRSTNRYRATATRAVLAEWDLTVHGAIKVCLPAPGPACE